ncbi:MAG: plastocyanin/azurin family copper-binding protein [Acidimicrobiia bacterium]|nr:plastocyanin/azurin family copper-binding protein [Acidimicrobiia bacterium]
MRSRSRARTVGIVTVTAAALLVLGACSSGDDDTTTDGEHMEEGGGHTENSPVAPGARTIEVSSTSFEYGTPMIEATVGEDIEISLTADDVLHDFIIDELDAHVSAEPGETASGGFTASEAGEYTFYCSVPGHRDAGMEGTLVVTES